MKHYKELKDAKTDKFLINKLKNFNNKIKKLHRINSKLYFA